MEPSVIGPYILLGLGIIAVIAAIFGHFKQLPVKSAVLVWIFGVALLGMGAYGPKFLADYAGFIKALNQFSETASDPKQVAEFLDSADKAGVSPAAREAILVDVLGRQVSAAETAGEAEATLQAALDNLPQESENRLVLKEAKARIQAEITVRDLARRHIEAVATSADAPTIEVGELAPILRLRDDQLREFHFDRETVTMAVERSHGGG